MSKDVSPRLGVLLVVLLLSLDAGAAPLKIVGFDDMSCRAWIQSKDDAEVHNSHLAWIRGVLTGHNYANQSQQVSAMSPGTVQNFVDRYCVEMSEAANPDIASYASFNDFFTRALKPGARPLAAAELILS